MKKVLFLSMVVFVLGFGSLALAQCMNYDNNGYGAGYGCGYGPNCGYDGGYGRHGGHKNMRNDGRGMPMNNMNMPESTVKSEKEATALVQKYLDNNYKGYKIAKTEPFTTPRGFQAYQITVNDASGNSFGFHVNPWGQVRGPFLNK